LEAVLVRRGANSAFRAALRQTVAKWRPETAYLDDTLMAPYAADCEFAGNHAIHCGFPLQTTK
jgi:hypothetical protein